MQVSDNSQRAAKYVFFGFLTVKLLAIVSGAIVAVILLILLLDKYGDIAEKIINIVERVQRRF